MWAQYVFLFLLVLKFLLALFRCKMAFSLISRKFKDTQPFLGVCMQTGQTTKPTRTANFDSIWIGLI